MQMQFCSGRPPSAPVQVINYMTLGMDMSALFPVMCSCANLSPDDVVLKKMLYLYITHYSACAPDLALLTINQLHKDSGDTDPMIRGLALRSLCSLRVPNFVEYVLTPISTVRRISFVWSPLPPSRPPQSVTPLCEVYYMSPLTPKTGTWHCCSASYRMHCFHMFPSPLLSVLL